jgi:hypothetical protein
MEGVISGIGGTKMEDDYERQQRKREDAKQDERRQENLKRELQQGEDRARALGQNIRGLAARGNIAAIYAALGIPYPNSKPLEPTPPSPPNNLDISGTWRDSTGTVYQITQRGKTFEFTANNPSIGASSRGSGTINGQDFKSVFTTNLLSSGSGVGKISADGSQITGTFDDPLVGRYTRTL